MTILIDDITPDDFSWHWAISNFTMLRGYRGLTNIVTTVHMGITGVWTAPDEQVWVSGQTFSVDVTYPNIDAISAEAYTDVSDLTEQQVMGWCMERLTEDQIANAKQMCVEDVKHRRTWTFAVPPWIEINPVPTPEEPKA